MYTPAQSLRVKGAAGDPLPTVFESLDLKRTRFLRGQLVLIVAGPGTGKSAFVLNYAVRTGVSTLYFSADSDAFIQLTRMISMQTGLSFEQAAQHVRENDISEFKDVLEGLPIRFNYDASLNLDQIENSMAAYFQLAGDYPELVVVDNLTNVHDGATDSENPYVGMDGLMDYLHDMARRTSACVIVLHHVQGQYNDGDKPIPLSGVKGQITRVPEMVLTLHRTSEEFGNDYLNVSTVKNRGGPQDPTGNDFVSLIYEGDTMTIRDA